MNYVCIIFITNSAYRPPFLLNNSTCVPCSTTLPFSNTIIKSAFCTVVNLCAIITTVLCIPKEIKES